MISIRLVQPLATPGRHGTGGRFAGVALVRMALGGDLAVHQLREQDGVVMASRRHKTQETLVGAWIRGLNVS
jgi:hypothetical protein